MRFFPVIRKKYETETITAYIYCLRSSERARQCGGLKKSHHVVSKRQAHNYPVTWHHILEERRPLVHFCYGLKLAIVIPFEFNGFLECLRHCNFSNIEPSPEG